jgi:hypothetical protein
MSDEETKKECSHMDAALNWLKIVDDWTVAGYKNKFPRMYYAVVGLIVLFLII